MLRRTVLQLVLSGVATCFAPLTALLPKTQRLCGDVKHLPPLQADASMPYPYADDVLELTGTPDQLCEFYREYQNALWPVTETAAGADREAYLAPIYAQVRRDAQQFGRLWVVMHGFPFGDRKLDPYAQAAITAVVATSCILSQEAATVMQLLNADIQRPRSCTEERC